MGLIIRSSSIHAAGCYTTSPIPKGTRVVEYTGPLIDKDEADIRYENKPITYLFGIGDGTQVIDGHGTAMFINHSCDANCETEEIEGRVWIMAIRDIPAGAELCYDYCLYDGDEEEAPCNCGTKKCRGSMYSSEELSRRKKLAKGKVRQPAKAALKKLKNKKSLPVKSTQRTSTHRKKQSATNQTVSRSSKSKNVRGNKKSIKKSGKTAGKKLARRSGG